jgi:hypothetical protein
MRLAASVNPLSYQPLAAVVLVGKKGVKETTGMPGGDANLGENALQPPPLL